MTRAIILAAGKGSRICSEGNDLPKVLRKIRGKTLLDAVLEGLDFIPDDKKLLVLGYQSQKVLEHLRQQGRDLAYVLQEPQLGTGHAVQQAREWIAGSEEPVLVCYGDMPLIRKDSYEKLCQLQQERQAGCVLLDYHTPRELAYGRLLSNERGELLRIVEDRDCSLEEKAIRHYNIGVYVFRPDLLLEGLQSLQPNNAQKEYYLTDVPGYLQSKGERILLQPTSGRYEGQGVNTQEDLDLIEGWMQEGLL